MKRTLFSLLAGLVSLSLAGCTISLAGTPTPFVFPTLPLASPTLPQASPTPTVATVTPAVASPTLPLPTLTPVPGPSATPGSPSGPYAVILVSSPGEPLNIRSGPGVGNPVVGTFPSTATNVMRTGPSSDIAGDLWVQVQNPGGGTGWVNSHFLTEYVSGTVFCADSRVNDLLTNFGNALRSSNGELLGSLVSPVHGMAVRYWRYYSSKQNIFDQAHASALFESTYPHNWGAAAGSGLDTLGAFHDVVLPKLLDVFNASYTLSCNTPQTGGASYDTSWPPEYTNINFYSVSRPGTPGVDLDWRTWLVGVEYVNNQPYLVSLIHFQWEP